MTGWRDRPLSESRSSRVAAGRSWIAKVVAVCVVAAFFMGFPNYCLPVLAVAAAARARQDLRRLRHLALWAAVVSLLSQNYSVDSRACR